MFAALTALALAATVPHAPRAAKPAEAEPPPVEVWHLGTLPDHAAAIAAVAECDAALSLLAEIGVSQPGLAERREAWDDLKQAHWWVACDEPDFARGYLGRLRKRLGWVGYAHATMPAPGILPGVGFGPPKGQP